jgi:hypothetical protein
MTVMTASGVQAYVEKAQKYMSERQAHRDRVRKLRSGRHHRTDFPLHVAGL